MPYQLVTDTMHVPAGNPVLRDIGLYLRTRIKLHFKEQAEVGAGGIAGAPTVHVNSISGRR